MTDLALARKVEYAAQLEATRLRRAYYEEGADDAALVAAEQRLADAEAARRALQRDDDESGVVINTKQERHTLGADTTGLEVTVTLRMTHVPTAIAHLLDPARDPLVECAIHNADTKKRRVRTTATVDGYSAAAVDSVEIPAKKTHAFLLLPILDPTATRRVTELTRASLNVLVEDLDSEERRVELQRSIPIWLLARSSAPLSIEDPKDGSWRDMTPYFGAFVTPNAPSVQTFLRSAARRHPAGQLVGYQGERADVTVQIQAMFDALKADADLTYVNSVLTTSPREGFAEQRVRVPRESLHDKQANCIDGTVLFASLIEAASMHAAIVIVPGHAFVAWQTWDDADEWRYLETTMTGSDDFATACQAGEATAARFADRRRIHAVPALRSEHGITPLE
jgi:hypothetical protein